MLAERTERWVHKQPVWEFIQHPKYKYVLTSPHGHTLMYCGEMIGASVHLRTGTEDWVTLFRDGNMRIRAGYAWDGASGPAIDTTDFIRGSLIHDVLYQFIAAGLLHEAWKPLADRELYRIVREDGMSLWRAWWVWAAVRVFGSASEVYRP